MSAHSGPPIGPNEQAAMNEWALWLCDITVRVAHCKTCGAIDPYDPFVPWCDQGHLMHPCSISKFRLLKLSAPAN